MKTLQSCCDVFFYGLGNGSWLCERFAAASKNQRAGVDEILDGTCHPGVVVVAVKQRQYGALDEVERYRFMTDVGRPRMTVTRVKASELVGVRLFTDARACANGLGGDVGNAGQHHVEGGARHVCNGVRLIIASAGCNRDKVSGCGR